jgi:hypothetical protein
MRSCPGVATNGSDVQTRTGRAISCTPEFERIKGSKAVAQRANLVNLDAMIARSDFAAQQSEETHFETIANISVRDFTKGALIGPNLRKPDFQRETNHWTPDQVASLLNCFVSGELVPSVILWKSSSYLFVIDGGHRLSVLRAWIEDDYGDGPISQAFFGYEVSGEQKAVAERTRRLVNTKVGSWRHFETRQEQPDLSPEERKRLNSVISRALPIQWVNGDADKAESSFFRINTKGTPLDELEELLLKNRRKPISICARAVIRAGKGHRYWSFFPSPVAKQIETHAKDLHQVLFEPELKTPVKTLDLPLGGSKGIRTALQVLIDFMLIASRDQSGKPAKVEDQTEDIDGNSSLSGMGRALRLAKRITGNDSGSLGLHPAVYFYGPTGRHSGPMFMGTVALIGKRLANNDSQFFKKFSEARQNLETVLIQNKDLIATILQKHPSLRRVSAYESMLASLVDHLKAGGEVNETWLISQSGLKGKVVTGVADTSSTRFSDDTKSGVFIKAALDRAMKCSICGGYLDPEKSMSYDHADRVRDGGTGDAENCQLVHPYCNQSIKC